MLIGVAGKAYSGKDTIGKHFCSKYNFMQDAFANDLKRYAIKYFGFTKEQVKEKSPETRAVLVAIGEMMRNEVHENFWVDKVVFRYDLLKARDEKGRMVITDVRYPSEVSAIRSLGGIIIKVERPDAPKNECEKSRLLEEKTLSKIKGDFNILSKDSIEDLHKIIDGFCTDFMITSGIHFK